MGFAVLGVLRAWGCRGRRARSNGGSIRPGRPQFLQSQPPYILLHVYRKLVAVSQVLVFKFTQTCQGLEIHGAWFAARCFVVFRGYALWGLRDWGSWGRGVVEDAAPDPTEALFGQEASLSLRYAQHICRAKSGLATRVT